MPKVFGAFHSFRSLFLLVAILLCGAAPAAGAASRDFVAFDSLTPRLEKKSELLGRRLSLVLSRHRRSLNRAADACRSGERPACKVETWRDYLAGIAGRGEAEQLRLVNRYVNGARYVTDRRNWKRADYWAVPEELFARGGDCEDYVVAKYLSLRALGMPPERLRIVVLYDGRRREDHAVLTVLGGGGTLVLDNHHRRVMTWAELRRWYRPYYSLNEDSVWIHSSKV